MDELMHYGILGMKWGVRRTPEELGHTRTTSLNKVAKKMMTFKYTDYTTLQSPEETERKKSGSCHDYTMWAMNALRKEGLDPKAKFLIEYDPKTGEGGMTHSFVYVEDGKKVRWIEHGWSERDGINTYNSIEDIVSSIKDAHKSGEYGNIGKFANLDIVDFDDRMHKPGETLGEFVDTVYS